MDSGSRLVSKNSVAISKIWLANQGAWANWATWVSSCRLTQRRSYDLLRSSSSRIIMTLGATSIRRGLASGPAAWAAYGSNWPSTLVDRKARTAPTWAPEKPAVTPEPMLFMNASLTSPSWLNAGSSMTCNDSEFAVIHPGRSTTNTSTSRSEEHTSELQSRDHLV